MSTIDTSTWNPDANLNTEIEGIPLNSDAGIAQTWQALRILMAAVKGDGDAIKAMISVMQGATASADGASGLVPKPEAGDQDKVLKGDGTWGTVTASSVAWSDVTGKPSSFTPSSHTHGNLTNDGKLGTASRVVVTDGSKVIGVSSITTTKLGYLTDVTANIQGQIDGKADKATTLSGYGITDAKIANGTITLGSSSITPLTSVPSHNQASNTINAMTGYSKPSSTSAIAATDSLNTAVGKLEKETEYLGGEILLVDAEAANGVAIASANQLFINNLQDDKADDTTVVHKTGDESISGTKTFSTKIIGKSFEYKSTNIDRSDTSTDSEVENWPHAYKDKNGDYLGRYGVYRRSKNGMSRHRFRLYNTNNAWADLIFEFKDDGQYFLRMTGSSGTVSGGFSGNVATATKLAASRTISLTGDVSGSTSFDGSANASITATVADDSHNHVISNVDGLQTALDAKAADSAVVHKTGNETIAGTKTFSSTISGSVSGNAGTATKIQATPEGTSWVNGVKAGGALVSSTATFYGAILNAPVKEYRISLGTFPAQTNLVYLRSLSNDNVETGTNTIAKQLTWDASNGTLTTAAFSGTVLTSSDERLKTPLANIPDAVLDAWEDVQWGEFQYLDAVDCKGESARLHLGLIAQRVKAVFEAKGLDACQYGILCRDKNDGMWSVRYAEALAMEAVCQRRRADRLEKRMADLEARLTATEVANG